jgi:hypothetical protein
MARKKRTASQLLDDAEANGLVPVTESSINGDRVYRVIENGTKTNYTRMLDAWDK